MAARSTCCCWPRTCADYPSTRSRCTRDSRYDLAARHRSAFAVSRARRREGARHLATTTERLFTVPFTPQRVADLEHEPDLAERVDAFVSRFGRLQDTLGDKLLPVLLSALGEKTAAVIDNLDRAERLGLIPSAEQWMEMRKLRNQMVHDYVEDPLVLADALETAHGYRPGADGCGGAVAR